MSNFQYIYLHGFASSPQSEKAEYFKYCFQEIGIKLNIIDLNNNDFSHLTLTRQINQVANSFSGDNETRIRIIGSSFGGLTATWLAEKYTQIDSIILLAPAFEFKNHLLTKLSQETIKKWEKKGYMPVYHYGEKTEIPLHYHFWEDLNQYEDTQLKKPISTLIIHGINDEVIPFNSSRKYAENRPWVKLIEVNSDHLLTDSKIQIWSEIKTFLTDF